MAEQQLDDAEQYEVTSEVGPWAMVPIWVLEVGLQGAEVAVYVALRSFADRAGQAYPKVKTIAARAGCSERTAERALARFRELGLMSSQQIHRPDGSIGGCVYLLFDVPRPQHVSPGGDTHVATPAAQVSPPGVTRVAARTHQRTHQGTQGGRPARADASPPSGALPPRFCDDHPAGTATPCRACGTAGKAHDLAAQRLAEERDRERHERLVADDLAARRAAAPAPIDRLREAVRRNRTG